MHGQDIDRPITLDRVLAPHFIAFAFELLGGSVHPEHVLETLAQLRAGVDPE